MSYNELSQQSNETDESRQPRDPITTRPPNEPMVYRHMYISTTVLRDIIRLVDTSN